ncbi:hypothetical protein AV656_03390 [Bhargavaea cecembensis]|uniref:DoxX family protein n=1 Tax=Bhargavaea cecembensis TaxID=394098 RepID=A0A161SRG5_9BACL|nr:hypothetical protein [Bhargavaea cecembensis]KZE37990.1 hypothetical protein AV656_03390 [Bhargavaea cecembensis]
MNRRLIQICRVLLGVIFLGAGINGYVVFFGFEPFIATSPEAMALFMFDYLLFVEKTLEIICGILLLTNQFVPMALAALSPIVANIFLLHLFVDPSMLALAAVIVLLHGLLLYHYKSHFAGLFVRKPHAPDPAVPPSAAPLGD